MNIKSCLFKKYLRTLVLISTLALMLVFFSIGANAAETVASGSCGDNVNYVLDSDGVLTISGEGRMTDFNILDLSPWYSDHHSNIIKVVVEEGVTSIGTFAFRWCENITEFTFPNTLTSIGKGAFSFCEKITSISIPSSVEYIGEYAFEWNPPLQDVYITDLDAWMNIEFKDNQSNPLFWARNLYLNGNLVTEAVYPEGKTHVGLCFTGMECLKKVVLPNGIISIADYAFGDCTNLEEINIPSSVKKIGTWAFANCSKLSSIELSDNVTSLESTAFAFCDSLTTITIPNGLKKIESNVFRSCDNLQEIVIPNTLSSVDECAFDGCYQLKDVYFNGSESQWEELKKNIHSNNTYLLAAEVHFINNPLVIHSDVSNLAIEIGDTITLSAGIWIDEQTMGDPSGITIQFENGYLVEICDTGIIDGAFFVKMEGKYEGTAFVTFNDTLSGKTATVPVTVREDNHDSFTVSNVPEQYIDKNTPQNFYNFNGLYIEKYKYTLKDDMTAVISFDVYNYNFTYAIAEVYDENGDLYNAALIAKRKDYTTGFYNVLGEGTAAAFRSWYNGYGISSYRNEMNTTKTSVEVEVPKNGYLKITTDPVESNVLTVINSVDLLLNLRSLSKDIDGFDPGNSEFAEKLTFKIVKDAAFDNLKKDGSKIFSKLYKDIGKDFFVTTETVGDFIDTLSKQLIELNLEDAIGKSLLESGISLGENVVMDLLGPVGEGMETMFLIGKAGLAYYSLSDFVYSIDSGAICIQNQSGGLRSAQQITLRSDINFHPDTAVQAFSVEVSDDLLQLVKNADKESYDLLTKNIVRTYDISLVRNKQKVQHESEVTVYIPIHDNLETLPLSGNISVYRIEEDGTLTDMDAIVDGDVIMFTTDHFSLYTVVYHDSELTTDNASDAFVTTDEDNIATDQPESDDINDNHDGANNIITNLLFIGGVIAIILVVIAGVAIAIGCKKKSK